LALAGCDSLNKPKVDNPVMGPPPPRMSFNNDPANFNESPLQTADAGNDFPALEDSQVAQANLETVGNNPLSGSQTVAIVNGSPILASEVLERYGPQLAAAKEKLPPEKYDEARLMLLKQDLASHIERKVLADGLKAMLKKEQIDMLNTFINQAFETEVARMMKEAGVNSKVELEEELRKQHTSLANLKTNFANQRMAMEFLGSNTQSDIKVGRPELLQFYNEHHEDYFVPARVKWQQIMVDFNKHGGRAGAQQRLNEIVAKMQPTRGANFTEVAKELSDGPNAANGGRWEWTKAGSLADKRIDEALFQLPPGRPSQVFESNDSFKIVMVDQREEGRYKPFDDLQDEIKETLEKDSRKVAAQKFIDDIMAKAEITTIFDQPKTRLVNGSDADPDDFPFGVRR
jgi:parvulin-like peptidyl-prolyl isomerase